MKILITGSAGFMASALIESLPENYCLYCVDVVERPTSLKYNGEINWIEGSFVDDYVINNIPCDVDMAFHFATTTFPLTAEANLIKDIEENVLGSIKLFEYLYQNGCKKIVYASSSGAMYCNDIMENSEISVYPMSCYGVTKSCIEGYLRVLAKKYDKASISLRFSNPYGKGQSERVYGVIPLFIEKIKNGEEIVLFEKDIKKDFILINDVVRAILLLMDYEGPVREFNVSSSRLLSLEELIEIIESKLGVKANVIYKHSFYPELTTGIIKSNLLYNEIGWEPYGSIESEIERLIEFNK